MSARPNCPPPIRPLVGKTAEALKQWAANRENAQKGTGPRTEDGKGRSRRNALRHGLTAETVIEGLEESEDYRAFEATIVADYAAQTAVEREPVLRLDPPRDRYRNRPPAHSS